MIRVAGAVIVCVVAMGCGGSGTDPVRIAIGSDQCRLHRQRAGDNEAVCRVTMEARELRRRNPDFSSQRELADALRKHRAAQGSWRVEQPRGTGT